MLCTNVFAIDGMGLSKQTTNIPPLKKKKKKPTRRLTRILGRRNITGTAAQETTVIPVLWKTGK